MSGNKKLMALLNEHAASDFYVGGNIPRNKLKNAIAAFPISQNAEVLGLIDCTVFGSCDEGLAITDCGLFWKNDWIETTKSQLTWYEFLESAIQRNDDHILFGNGITFSTAGSAMNSKAVFNLLVAIGDLFGQIVQELIENPDEEEMAKLLINANNSENFGKFENIASEMLLRVLLEQNETETKRNKKRKNRQNIGISAGVFGSSQNYADNVILSAERGHGFAHCH